MPVIRSKIKPQTASFAANARRMEELLGEVQRLEQMVIAESASKRDKFEKRGQLLPRERVARPAQRHRRHHRRAASRPFRFRCW